MVTLRLFDSTLGPSLTCLVSISAAIPPMRAVVADCCPLAGQLCVSDIRTTQCPGSRGDELARSSTEPFDRVEEREREGPDRA